MSEPFSFGEIGVRIGDDAGPGRPDEDTPFRILVLGDFSGRASRGLVRPVAARRTVRVDRDAFDDLPEELETEVSVPVGDGAPIRLPIRTLDDLHPDRIFARVPSFEHLRDLRSRLLNPKGFASAAAEVRSWTAQDRGDQDAPDDEPAGPADAGGLLDMLLEGKKPEKVPVVTGVDDDLRRLVRELARPHVAETEDPQKDELVRAVDETTSSLMRSVLHHPSFQRVEAAWRSLELLVRRLSIDGPLELHLLDVSRDELEADLLASPDLTRCGLYRHLVEKTVDTPGGIPWTLLVGDLTFEATSRDAELLGRIGTLAARAGAPFVAGGSPGLVGCATIADAADPADWQSPPEADARAAWDALERMPQARYLGLALPRLLLRMPYGKATEPLERFAFEELTEDRPHESYLWGSASFAVALLLAEAFDAEGWDMTGARQEIDGLPFHVVRKDGQTSSKPCAEVVLTVRAYGRLLESGLMPLLSFKDQDLVRLPSVQSIASPSAPLAGRWGGSS